MKTASSPLTVDAYIETHDAATRVILKKLREVILKAAPKGEECITYGIPTVRYNGNLVHYAAYKHHIGFYPAPSGITAFKNELAGFKQAKGSVQFPLTEKIPYTLIAKIVRFRVQENKNRT